MKTSEFELGDFVTNGFFVRELISYEDDHIYYFDYALDDGHAIGHGLCSPETIARWTKRFASDEEIEHLDRDGARMNIFQRQQIDMLRHVRAAPTDMLEAELARRRNECG